MHRILAFDSGAERMGWASIWADKGDDGRPYPIYHASGIYYLPRGDLAFQEYRLMMVNDLTKMVATTLEFTQPDVVTTETVPPIGAGGIQMYLANTACTVVQAVAMQAGLPVKQIGATTVHKHVAFGRKKGQKASKVMVRNGVIQLLPELQHRKKSWVKVFDESDAIANALTGLGFSLNESGKRVR